MRPQILSLLATLSAAAVIPKAPATELVPKAEVETAPVQAAPVQATPAKARKSGFIIPKHHTDGTYKVNIDKNGQVTHTKLSSNPADLSSTKRSAPALAKRQDDYPTCADADQVVPLAASDINTAAGMLGGQCDAPGAEVEGDRAFYSISGPVAFYFCNFDDDNSHQCSSDYVNTASSTIQGFCGPKGGLGGWVDPMNGLVSYGYQLRTDEFCGMGVDTD